MTTLPRLALILMLAAGLVAAACSDDDKNDGGGKGPPDVTGEPTVTDSGLQIIDIEVGGGDEATAASTVTFHYSLWLEDGTPIQSSVGGEPVTYALSDLIAAWQEGIPGMKEGGKRRLIVPPELGYGEDGMPPDIPPNATLIFDIELVDTQ